MKTITVTITETGDQIFLAGHGGDVFCEAGETTLQRASHILPESLLLRACFRAIRFCVPDISRLAAWTRTWPCLWRVEIVGGPVLPARYSDRHEAIEAEIRFLNRFFFTGENHV